MTFVLLYFIEMSQWDSDASSDFCFVLFVIYSRFLLDPLGWPSEGSRWPSITPHSAGIERHFFLLPFHFRSFHSFCRSISSRISACRLRPSRRRGIEHGRRRAPF